MVGPFTAVIAPGVFVAARVIKENREVAGFSYHLSAIIGGKREDIYRVDTMHGGLHEHRFWLEQGRIWLKDEERLYSLRELCGIFHRKINENWESWVELFIRHKKG